ncbi:MAG TPA: SDR family oxidoreductase [Chloroflexota bacterium]|jgi:NAD(P)-dependent dehydrogenase (short-subunit alcohol dehydrogenase family)
MADVGKIALVTGGGSGIGRASALALARNGFSVVVTGRRQDALDTTVRDGQAAGGDLRAVVADVSDPTQVERVFADVRQTFGRLDVLFNNAGRGAPGINLEDLTPAQWLEVVGVNLNATFYCTQQAFKLMKDQTPRGGRIINNGSISAHAPRPNSAPYTATKHAVTGLTKATSLDGRKYDIACSQIDIGNAATEMASRMADGVPQADGQVRPEPLMDVEHVAQAVVFMACLPLETNVQFMTIMATKMPFVGRG